MFEASGELLLILVVALIVVGPSKLPELIRSFGKGLAEFRRMTGDVKATLERELERADELKRIGEIKKELFDEADKTRQVLTGVAQDVSGQVSEVGGQLGEVSREAGAVRSESQQAGATEAADETASPPGQAAGGRAAPNQEQAAAENVAREPAASSGKNVARALDEQTMAQAQVVASSAPGGMSDAASVASPAPGGQPDAASVSSEPGKQPDATPPQHEEKSHA